MGKFFGKAMPDPDAFYSMPYSTWEIFMTIDKVINFLKAKSHWAFIWTK
jgi:hypothetical protein